MAWVLSPPCLFLFLQVSFRVENQEGPPKQHENKLEKEGDKGFLVPEGMSGSSFVGREPRPGVVDVEFEEAVAN